MRRSGTGGGTASGGNGSGVGEPPPIATLVVYKDDAGYGMKVSGDNPVYVQSVKGGTNLIYILLYFYKTNYIYTLRKKDFSFQKISFVARNL